MDFDLNLLEFTKQYVASDEEWIDYTAVNHAERPKDLHYMFHPEQNSHLASEEYLERDRLEKIFVERIRPYFSSGEWTARGSWNGGLKYSDIDRQNWKKLYIDIVRNRLGGDVNAFTDLHLTKDMLPEDTDRAVRILRALFKENVSGLKKNNFRNIVQNTMMREFSDETWRGIWSVSNPPSKYSTGGRPKKHR